MKEPIQTIPLENLALSFLPVVVVVVILYRWSLGAGSSLYAMARMLIQLLLIGYVLAFIFETENALVVLSVLTGMLLIASWIALRPFNERSFSKALGAISLGGVTTLVLITQAVMDFQPWFNPEKMLPLAGMIFAGSMNAVSLAGERFYAEMGRGGSYEDSRRTALRASLIPITNSLFAVGLVSLPGMMTGQILSGVDPLVAARYQIMVMCMLFGSSGISAACYLVWVRPTEVDPARGE
ncbi:MAG: ABC transporter permease [Planctomycetales bacterium]|nr:ABC transporter permease [Planctomycetales bacterium]